MKSDNNYGLSEASNLALYFDIKTQIPKCIVVQVLLIKYFSPDENLQNIAAKMMISDGVSSVLWIMPNVVHKALSCKEIKQFDIIGVFNFEIKKLSDDNLVLLLKEPPNLIYKHITEVYGSPREYCQNVKYGFPKVEDSKIQLDEKTIYENGYYTQIKTDQDGYTPIKNLNQYSGTFWTIKARVVKKSNKKKWKNARGEGSLITVDLMDKDGSDIQATFFNEVCDEYEDFLQENRVYTFSGGSVKKAQSKYANLKNEWQITFDKKTVIEEVTDDGTIQINLGNFLTLNEVASLTSHEICDVRAIVHVVGNPTSITLKNGEEKIRKNIMLVDDTGFSICIWFWGDLASNFDFSNHPVILIKNVKIADFAGKSLNSHIDSKVSIDTDSSRWMELRKWYENVTAEDITRLTPLSIGTGLEKMMHEDFDRLIQAKRMQEDGDGEEDDNLFNSNKLNESELNIVPQTSAELINSEFEEFMRQQSLQSNLNVHNENKNKIVNHQTSIEEHKELKVSDSNKSINKINDESNLKESKSVVLKIIQEEIEDIEDFQKPISNSKVIEEENFSSWFKSSNSNKKINEFKSCFKNKREWSDSKSLNKVTFNQSKIVQQADKDEEENLFSSLNKK